LAFVSDDENNFLIDRDGERLVRVPGKNWNMAKDGIRFKEDELWGMCDLEGNTFLEPKYYYIGDFSEGKVAVIKSDQSGSRDGDWHCVDDKGRVLFTRELGFGEFKEGRSITSGWRVMSRGNKAAWGKGFIDSKGWEIIEARYSKVTQFSGGVAVVMESQGPVHIIDLDGRTIAETDLKFRSEHVTLEPFDDGLARVLFSPNNCILDLQGNLLVLKDYQRVEPASEGLLAASGNQWAKSAWVNLKGEEAIVPDGENPRPFAEGLGSYLDVHHKRTTFVNKMGSVVFETDLHGNGYFSEGLVALYDTTTNNTSYLDKQGNPAIPACSGSGSPFKEGFASLRIGKEYGVIDKAGNFTIEPRYHALREFSEGVAAFGLDGKWGYVTPGGVEVVPARFEQAWSFVDGCAIVKIDGKFGYVNKQGVFVIPARYDVAHPFSDGLAVVAEFTGRPEQMERYGSHPGWPTGKHWKYRFIDKRGREAFECDFLQIKSFHEGLAAVKIARPNEYRSSSWEYIDTSGKVVTDLRLRTADEFSEGVAIVAPPTSYAYIDLDGNVVWPPTY
jgi:hypothetical protein